MKKIFIYLFGLLIAFASCAKIEEMSFEDLRNNAPQEVVFNTGAVKVTKAIINADTLPAGTYFGVYGYIQTKTNIAPVGQSTSNYLLQNAKYHAGGVNEGKAADTKYYWPNADNNKDILANFVAYYPWTDKTDTIKFYKVAADGYSEGDIIYKYGIKNTLEELDTIKAKDVLYAVKYNFNPGNIPNYGKSNKVTDSLANRVPLNFKHALSYIQFEGNYANYISEVTINSIKFKTAGASTTTGIFTNGELKFNVKNLTSDNDNPVSTLNNSAERVDINFVANAPKTLDTDVQTYDTLSSAIIFPQAVPDTVILAYNIKLEYADGLIEYQNRTVTKVINSGKDENAVAFPPTWKSGYKYIYRYFITADEIKFTVTVLDWKVQDNYYQVWDVE